MEFSLTKKKKKKKKNIFLCTKMNYFGLFLNFAHELYKFASHFEEW